MAAAISAAAPAPCTAHGVKIISTAGIAPPHHLQDIANGRAGRGRDQADALRKTGQGPFSFGRKKPFRAELLLEFFKGGLERADALQFHGQHLQLILSARLINGDVALENHLPPVGQRAAMGHGVAAKKHAAQLRARVLEGEINVPGHLLAEVGDFPRDPNLADLFFQRAPDVRRQFADGENAPRRLRREEFRAKIPWL